MASPQAEALRIIRRTYPLGHPSRPVSERRPPLDELILTVLSQNTSDVNRDRAWASLRTKYPTWERVERAPVTALARAIAPGGLAVTKAPRIKAILKEVRAREGILDLDVLRTLKDAEGIAYLTSLPGVGRKTAACVLAFSLGRPVLPVDTHVSRIAQRLGIISEKAKPAEIQTALEQLVPARVRIDTHHAMIAHGRSTCHAQRPACGACPVMSLCPSSLR